MITHTTSARRRVALVSSAALLLGAAAAVTAGAESSGSAKKPTSPTSNYQDYLGGQTGDQCALSVSQRSGGWVCPQTSDRK